VLANPPFSQNYIRKDIEYPGRFAVWLPEKGKKADLMFVQHMAAVLKADGKMATIMPHGVLFRRGEEMVSLPKRWSSMTPSVNGRNFRVF
jgi:type I restriction enzyme M protein